jgi:hypothetical protein
MKKEMKKFAHITLRLRKDITKGDKESLLSLFSATERFKHMEVLIDADENSIMNVDLEGLGDADLLLGDDMEKGQNKTIMTLFWYSERSKPVEMKRDAKAGEKINMSIWRN